MTSSQLLGPTGTIRSEVESVVASAERAPSIHNTQPWGWTFYDAVLELRADRRRQLHIADRDGHSLLVSCGAAAELTELALRAQGWSVDSSVLPDPTDSDLLFRFILLRRDQPDPSAVALLAASAVRRSERRPFGPLPVGAAVIDVLRDAAALPGVYVQFVTREDDCVDLAVAVDHADHFQRDDPAYQAELAFWRRDDADDGIPDASVPALGEHSRHTDIDLRDFEAGSPGGQLMTTRVDERPLIAVVRSATDRSEDRLNAGRVMMRLMLSAQQHDVASCPLSQSVDLLSFRTRLRTLMGWNDYPQMMVRLGARIGATPAPLTARRPVDDVLTFG